MAAYTTSGAAPVLAGWFVRWAKAHFLFALPYMEIAGSPASP
jgi:hypothetical protein